MRNKNNKNLMNINLENKIKKDRDKTTNLNKDQETLMDRSERSKKTLMNTSSSQSKKKRKKREI